MVDDKNLPFVGQAVPLGDRRFLLRQGERRRSDGVLHGDAGGLFTRKKLMLYHYRVGGGI